MFINVSHQLSDRNLNLVILNNDFDIIFKQIPSWVTVLNFDEYALIRRLRNAGKYRLVALPVQIMIFFIQLFIIRYDKKYRADLNVNFSDTLSTLLAACIGKGPSVSWIHLNPKMLFGRVKRYFYKSLYKRCKVVVCICNEQREEFGRFMVHPHTRVIYNTVNVRLLDERRQEALNFVNGEYMLMVARLDLRSKDFFTVIDAYERLYEEHNISYKLVFLGEGQDRPVIEQYIQEKGLGHLIFLPGNDVNPYKWMTNAKVFIFSSRFEGFGLVLVEAMCCNVPVISTDCEVGPTEILGGGEYGILVKTGNVSEMKNAIWRMLNKDEAEIRTQVEFARKRSLEFDLNNKSNIIDLFANI